ncbi:MAG: CoB--CoM heterodisulfide reductase iron-sulfur subunit B family protein [Chloroflexi bacterium]|jgi:heterodisulfide reductase subunit B2|nr:CoB--CoM heterodisulfide reductase iron-sulfur subunit B family protein [Chloroflexota bacterium]MBT7081421.1 CoB--CoM heterodisulfide reductase iron-sulfur subunit B family protein [Chloroflexota bacterium]
MRYAYYPGCSLHQSGEEYDHSLHAVCEKLDVELVEIEKWVCCGSTAAHNKSKLLGASLPMANLALLPKMELDEVVVPCPECFSKLKTAQHNVKEDKNFRKDVADVIQTECNEDALVSHPLKILSQEPLLSKIPTAIQRDLSNLKVVCYYGCLITRPAKIAAFDNCEYPETMDRVLQAAGVTTLDWDYKTACCGASLAMSKPDIVVNLSHKLIEGAKAVGADAIVVACPFCHMNLDARQPDMEKEFGTAPEMPVLYFTQLMAYSFGVEQKELEVNKHMTDTQSVFDKINAPTEEETAPTEKEEDFFEELHSHK